MEWHKGHPEILVWRQEVLRSSLLQHQEREEQGVERVSKEGDDGLQHETRLPREGPGMKEPFQKLLTVLSYC